MPCGPPPRPRRGGGEVFGETGATDAEYAPVVARTRQFRSAALPAAASWVRAVRPALAVGLVVSSLGFAAVHGSSDPWLFDYHTVIALSTSLPGGATAGTREAVSAARSVERLVRCP